MTFEQWQQRPVYTVRVWTCHLARRLGLPIGELQLVPHYRHGNTRKRVADAARDYRRGGMDRADVRSLAARIIANPRGYATRVDIDTELAANA